MAPTALARPPEARVETVDDLVRLARRGRVRVPRFQRGLKWDAGDVCALFDSIYRGLPIGALLVWKRTAPAAAIKMGPMAVNAEAFADAWSLPFVCIAS